MIEFLFSTSCSGIRHPEELSLSLPLVKDDLKKDHGFARVARSKSHYDVMNSDLNGRTISRDSLSSSASSHFNRSSNQSLPPSSAFLRGSFYGNRNSGRFSLRRRRKSVVCLSFCGDFEETLIFVVIIVVIIIYILYIII